MKELDKKELLKVEGGGIAPVVGFVLVSVASFVFGVIDGYLRPLKCNS